MLVKKYKAFFNAGIMNLFAYKFNFITWFILSVLQLLAVFFLWNAVFANSSDGMNSIINGFTFKEIIVYLSFANVFTFVSLTSETNGTIEDEIKDGTIAISFIKPISYRLRFLFTTLGQCFATNVLLGLPIFVILYVVFVKLKFIVIQSVSIFIVNILLFLLNQFFAIVMFDCVAYFCGVLCFYTNAGWGINQAKNVIIKFLSGAVIPISFFPEVLQKIINVLPFSGFVSNPVSILLMKNSFAESIEISLKNFAWMILLELVAKIVFNHASKKVTVQGG